MNRGARLIPGPNLILGPNIMLWPSLILGPHPIPRTHMAVIGPHRLLSVVYISCCFCVVCWGFIWYALVATFV